MSKYYAIKAGHQTGIYREWSIAQQHVNGYKGAEFKSFKTLGEAEVYMGFRGAIDENEHCNLCIYTDGSCIDEQGGYAFVVLCDNQVIIEEYNKVPTQSCTNQVAELYAIYRALSWLHLSENASKRVIIRSDSMYAIRSLTVHIKLWRMNNFRTTKKKGVKNKDLIIKCSDLLLPLMTFKHVSAHCNNHYNVIVDKLANKGRLLLLSPHSI